MVACRTFKEHSAVFWGYLIYLQLDSDYYLSSIHLLYMNFDIHGFYLNLNTFA